MYNNYKVKVKKSENKKYTIPIAASPSQNSPQI